MRWVGGGESRGAKIKWQSEAEGVTAVVCRLLLFGFPSFFIPLVMHLSHDVVAVQDYFVLFGVQIRQCIECIVNT